MEQAPPLPPPSRPGSDWNDLRAFLTAVLCGSLAAGAPAMLLSVPAGLWFMFDQVAPASGVLLIFLPPLVALPFVLGASLLIGLPLTALLRGWNREAGEYYIIAGLTCGAVPFLVWMVLPGGNASVSLFALSGALGGGVTGWRWGRYRDGLRGERE